MKQNGWPLRNRDKQCSHITCQIRKLNDNLKIISIKKLLHTLFLDLKRFIFIAHSLIKRTL